MTQLRNLLTLRKNLYNNHMLHYLNYLVLQWFFIRLARVLDDNDKQTGWTILKVMPLSGYGGRPYRFWSK